VVHFFFSFQAQLVPLLKDELLGVMRGAVDSWLEESER